MYRCSESVSQCINALFQIIKASHIYRKEISIVDISTLLKNIDIDKDILQNIDIDKISNRLEFGISNSYTCSIYVQVTKYLEYIGKFSTCLRTQAGRLFGVWGALLCFSIHKSYKKLVKSTYVVRVPL